MIDRILGPGLGQNESSFYFQLIPISLTLVNTNSALPPPDTTYKFSVFKGSQRFDENKIPITAEFVKVGNVHSLPINSCRLNFYQPTLVKGRKVEFTLRAIQHEGSQDYELGDYKFDVAILVEQFKSEKVSRHELKAPFSEDYELEFEIYVDNNRVSLEKNIRENRNERAVKSPLRQRKEVEEKGSQRKGFTGSKSETKKSSEPQPKEEQSQPDQTVQVNIEEKITAQPELPAEEPVREPRRSNPAPAPVPRSEKAGSISSKPGVPLVQTKFKGLAKPDCPSEIQLTQSQKLGETSVEHVLHSSGQPDPKQRLFLVIFLLVGLGMIFWAMNPSRKI